MFEETVQQWIREMIQEGALQGNDREFLRRLTIQYARKLEDIFCHEVKKTLEPSGKADEFERMLLYDSQYINKYLNQVIPGYPGFRITIFDKAKKVILGI